ncbi:protein of unknown function DUF1007 [Methylobacterium nodulans ORS 2060]|uniref:DUF1007 family protein n=1 Tax=Methylobacterium nodulans (strain LMG 21967 / CNCM I-2342 / ORS 2060) TaxID=460265 RepID=B8IRL5_METNO|nr:protein of unknown function DUF1007 [Methylobacterium nodulans ORS 2060]
MLHARMSLSRGLLALWLLAATSLPAVAHPHVWITARAEVVFDQAHALTGIRHTWTFDRTYSAFSVVGLDTNHDGVPDPDKLAELARTNVESLANLNWFTQAKIDGQPVEFAPPSEYSQSFADGELTLRFTLPLKTPARAKEVALQMADPSFFVAINLSEAADAVTLGGEPGACTLSVKRPDKSADEGIQLLADDIASALAGKGSATPVGEAFTAHVRVTCP